MNLSKNSLKVLASLRSHIIRERSDRFGGRWGEVILANARPENFTDKEFSKCLAALEQACFYIRFDGDKFGVYGEVKLLPEE